MQARAENILVFAAISLKEALDAQVAAYTKEYVAQVRVSYAGSNTLAKQIENGAPADLFLSADTQWMDYLQTGGHIVAASRKNLLGNSLVLIAPNKFPMPFRVNSVNDWGNVLAQGPLAIADPEGVPAGRYARAALEKMGLWPLVMRRLARTDSVRGALQLVARRAAPIGIVYGTDALAEPGVQVLHTFAPETYPQIVYTVALTRFSTSKEAAGFLNYLSSASARKVWEARGFRVLTTP